MLRKADSVVESLMLDLLDWLTQRDRTNEEVLAAWRTSYPRVPVWEDANDRGLIKTEEVIGRSIVRVTPAGLALLTSQLSLVRAYFESQLRYSPPVHRSPEIGTA